MDNDFSKIKVTCNFFPQDKQDNNSDIEEENDSIFRSYVKVYKLESSKASTQNSLSL